MFGTNKIKIKGRTFYYSRSLGNCIKIYNAKGKYLIQYKIIYNLCSVNIIQDISVGYGITTYEKKTIMMALPYTMRSRVNVTFQNVTKNTYDILIGAGFIDYSRLPGAYIEEGSTLSGGKTKTNECLALMVKSNKNLTPATKKTIELLKNLS